MPLYSASQLIGKTIILNKDVNYYDVYDINNFGDNAKPIGIMKKGQQFIIDSFLAPTDGYTNSYGITYEKRIYPYFTFYNGANYDAIAVVADGRFSLSALKEQGALTIKEEIRQKELSDMGAVGKFFAETFGNLSVPIKTGLIIIAVIISLYFLIPLISKIQSKQK
jgi:hypothetical protein